jgi:hypothetical protein
MRNNVDKMIINTRNFIIVKVKKGGGKDCYLNNEIFAIILTEEKQRKPRTFYVSRKQMWPQKKKTGKKMRLFLYKQQLCTCVINCTYLHIFLLLRKF